MGSSMITRGNIAGLEVIDVNLAPVSFGANASGGQTQTVQVPGLNPATDFIVGIERPAFQTGLGLSPGRVSAPNTFTIIWQNNTAAGIVPSPGRYRLIVARVNKQLETFQA